MYDEFQLTRGVREIPADAIRTTSLLQSSGSADLWVGHLVASDNRTGETQRLAAVMKRVRQGLRRSEELLLLLEAHFTVQLSHDNVTRVLGVVSTVAATVVFEHCAHGTVRSYLEHKSGNAQLHLALSHDVAAGVQYLNRLEITHRCLAAHSILVTDSLVAKISNFSFATDFQTDDEFVHS